ncbi:MAG: argininosuccinate lyase [Candidatus Thiodiazotropha sp. (ex Lucinoma aequizonata)]|nr:argininosuccinate lyase [Candidatus Thiodiazotropha sp. (ex Lucinoma aequizonata)]MCU7888030.1 argininosuccinate lyase [Candidatus Thiodiazotropha sp. (ex Lucinoma aequizonata)]MCU7896506.1 argininosuccinate lyase [Candidatus Thiodiazotropha sp. (ex Lucinoma aequizonata)]MCU7898098.1 argininosuccinate lyase [Candidatus Thiodiazotropha sp. (ex Lucinoma aequizonata)]MCU7901340.1 argininosuccinate lyase [Candidatus Thiodiazotropha sp. (ex Lucinoma aequizonata)]
MSDSHVPTKLWSGRFNQPTNAFVEAFTASVEFDQRLYQYDIQGSIAHATMLASQGILNDAERDAIVQGLELIRKRIEQDDFTWSVALEDVHMNIESALTEAIGDAGKKLHTGRSRNDQVATDIRLWLRDEIENIRTAILRLQAALLDKAELEIETILPGFTHLQTAQPVTFGHHLMAWFEMLERDRERLADCNKRLNVMPLGAAALAGTTYPIDRHQTAELLGFSCPAENSLDAVSDRDFAIEFSAVASILMMHLSRFSEELIIWSSAQFGFIELSDSFCTGSSIMPQKKNPDVPELIRGKTGRIFGHLIGLLTLMKSQPLAYNKDNQEDKEPLFDTVDNLKGSLNVFADMVPVITCRKEIMHRATMQGFATATDLADYLVRKGIPFRDAHEVVGKAVSFGVAEGRDLSEMSLQELQTFSSEIAADVFEILTLEGSLAARDHIGGTAPKQVRAAIIRARERLGLCS